MSNSLVLKTALGNQFVASEENPNVNTDATFYPPLLQMASIDIDVKNLKLNEIRLSGTLEWVVLFAQNRSVAASIVFEIRRDNPRTGELIYRCIDSGFVSSSNNPNDWTYVCTTFQHVDSIPIGCCAKDKKISYYLVVTLTRTTQYNVVGVTNPITFTAEQIENPSQITTPDIERLI